MGVVTPLGNSLDAFWNALVDGHRSFSDIGYFDVSVYQVASAGVVPWDSFFDTLPFTDRCSRYLALAIQSALEDAHLVTAEEIGLIVGTTSAGCTESEPAFKRYLAGETVFDQPGQAHQLPASCLLDNIASLFGLRGPGAVLCTACASGATAIGYARDLLVAGECEVMLAGGVDTLGEAAYCGLSSLRMLSSKGCQPFHAKRRGIQLSEGAGILVLETVKHAQQRGANIRALLTGFGASNNATHLARPDSNGIRLAIQAALKDAEIPATLVQYVNAHGSGTPANDRAELEALQQIFGTHINRIPISSIKSTLGHMQAAAGAVEAIATVMALERGVLPPTSGLDEIDPIWSELDFVPNVSRSVDLKVALSLSSGLGGDNACLVLQKMEKQA